MLPVKTMIMRGVIMKSMLKVIVMVNVILEVMEM